MISLWGFMIKRQKNRTWEWGYFYLKQIWHQKMQQQSNMSIGWLKRRLGCMNNNMMGNQQYKWLYGINCIGLPLMRKFWEGQGRYKGITKVDMVADAGLVWGSCYLSLSWGVAAGSSYFLEKLGIWFTCLYGRNGLQVRAGLAWRFRGTRLDGTRVGKVYR